MAIVFYLLLIVAFMIFLYWADKKNNGGDISGPDENGQYNAQAQCDPCRAYGYDEGCTARFVEDCPAKQQPNVETPNEDPCAGCRDGTGASSCGACTSCYVYRQKMGNT